MLLTTTLTKALAFDTNLVDLRSNTSNEQIDNIADGGGTCITSKALPANNLSETVNYLKIELQNSSPEIRNKVINDLINAVNETENF